MRKFTKTLLAFAVLFAAVGGAKAAVKQYELDQKLTTIASLSGKNFAIVDESVSKAFYGTGNQGVGFDDYATAFVETNTVIHFRLVAAEGAGVDGCYYLQSVKADGTDYSIWGGGYLNTTPENGNNCVFLMGLNGQNGQDCLNGAVWEIVENGGTFSIKNKGTGKYLKDSGPALNDDPTYFSFYTLKEHVDSDPLANEKADLQDAIDAGNLQNAFGKTAASFQILTDAITAGEAELSNASATAGSLTAAKDAINNAIDGFVLEDGYANLTTDMFKHWNNNNNPTESSDTGCAYNLNTNTGLAYGDVNVNYLNFADISDFNKLYVLVAAGAARVQMNRETDGGTTHIVTSSAAVTEVDFATAPELDGFNFVHLNAIKDNWGGLITTGMLLYRTITVEAAGYATFGSLYKNAKPNGVKAYAAKVSGSKVILTEVENVPAGKGVVIEAAAGSYAPTFDVDADDIDTDLLVSNGTVVGDGTIYVLANMSNGVGFYKLKNGEKLSAGKAYLKLDASAPDFLGFDGGTTSINELNVKGQAEGTYFNLAGQRVAQPTKGLYIVNGKKVIK